MRALATSGLVLEPLTVAHAEAMFELLSDLDLYRYLDDLPPASVEQLRNRYARLESRASADGKQRWLNWVVREPGQPPMGYVQATVLDNGSAWVAYLLGSRHRGRGHATQATAAMLEHLESDCGASRQIANVEAENLRSIRLLERLGFRAATAAEAAEHEPTATERIFVRGRPAVDRAPGRLRQAGRADVPAMHRVRLSVRENRLVSDVSERDYPPAIEQTGRGWVIEVDGAVVGFAIGNARSANIWALFVAPEHEGRGHGRRLHDAMVEWLFAQGLERLWLSTEPGTRAERFYRAAGWVSEGLLANGEASFSLARRMAP